MMLDIRHKNRVQVTPEVRKTSGVDVLEYVEIDATHERYGHGHVRLNREQVRHLAARFSSMSPLGTTRAPRRSR